MSSSPSTQHNTSGPWGSDSAGMGGAPNKTVDVPITAVFLVLFLCGAITHMTIFQLNRKRGRKFIMSGMTFGFCMARITASILRLVWSTHLTNVSIAIAASIFMAAGVLLLFVINLIFVQRIIRATHPTWAWSTWFSNLFKAYYTAIVILLIALIIAVVQSFYTLNPRTRSIDRTIQLVGSTFFAVSAFLPLPLLALNFALPRRAPAEKFGEGHILLKVAVIVISSTILTFGAAFRAGVAFVPRPANHPAWYHSKAVFYCINFTIEIIVVILFAVARVDKLFIIPNGARGTYLPQEKTSAVTSRVEDEESITGERDAVVESKA